MARKLGLLVTLAVFAVLFFFGDTRWSPAVHETMRWLGAGLIFVCISGRTWCSLYIGGRKNHELVTTGPYSVSRNPLYVFSIIGAIGIGAQFGAVSVAILAGVVRLAGPYPGGQAGRAAAARRARRGVRKIPRRGAALLAALLAVEERRRAGGAPARLRADLRRCLHLPRRHPGRRRRSISCTTSACCASSSGCPEPAPRRRPQRGPRTRSRCSR